MPLSLSPPIRLGTFTWTYEGWQGQVYKRQYAQEHLCSGVFWGVLAEWIRP
jgi:hypothetical protein